MTSFLQVCLGLLLVSCVHGQSSPYLSGLLGQCSAAILNQVGNCSTDLIRTLGISAADFATSTTAICGNIPALVTLNTCTRSAVQTCISSEYNGLFQTDDGVRDSYQYFCDHRNEINLSCVLAAIPTDPCSLNAAQAYITGLTQTVVVQKTCSFMEALRGCLHTKSTSCPNHNRDVFDTYWKKSYPPACAGGARSAPTSFLLLGACAVLLSKVAAIF